MMVYKQYEPTPPHASRVLCSFSLYQRKIAALCHCNQNFSVVIFPNFVYDGEMAHVLRTAL